MKLFDYIKKHHGGVNQSFADKNNMKRQQVEQCIKKGYYHVIDIEDKKMLVMAKREINQTGETQK